MILSCRDAIGRCMLTKLLEQKWKHRLAAV